MTGGERDCPVARHGPAPWIEIHGAVRRKIILWASPAGFRNPSLA